MIRRLFFVGILAMPCAVTSSPSQSSTLESTLRSAEKAADLYVEVMADLVADEKYEQDVLELAVIGGIQGSVGGVQWAPKVTRHRELRSDVALLRIDSPLEWRTFRDVREVDGKAVGDRTARVERLFRDPTSPANLQRLINESSRFNLTGLGRTLNEPGLPVLFLRSAVRSRFRFDLDQREANRGVLVLRYREQVRPTLFRHNKTADNPSSGRIWFDTETGSFVRTEHVVSPPDLEATFVTTFGRRENVAVALPIDMRESLANKASNMSRVEGRATCSRYRKFDISVEEGIR